MMRVFWGSLPILMILIISIILVVIDSINRKKKRA